MNCENPDSLTCDEEIVEDKKKSKKKKEEEKMLELEVENAQLKDQYLRLRAETENYKKRIEEERARERKYSSQRLLEKLITITDILDKACNVKTEDETLKNFLIGFQMINTNIQNILGEEGVKKIINLEMFDPRYHHAMEVDYDESKEEGAILAVFKDGYMYKDRILNASMVKVNKKPIENKNEEEK